MAWLAPYKTQMPSAPRRREVGNRAHGHSPASSSLLGYWVGLWGGCSLSSVLRPFPQVPNSLCEQQARHDEGRLSAQRSNPVRLVLCDDNRIFCEALAVALEARGHQALAIATTADEGVAAVARHQPDACLLDFRFHEGGEGLGAARMIRDQYP